MRGEGLTQKMAQDMRLFNSLKDSGLLRQLVRRFNTTTFAAHAQRLFGLVTSRQQQLGQQIAVLFDLRLDLVVRLSQLLFDQLV